MAPGCRAPARQRHCIRYFAVAIESIVFDEFLLRPESRWAGRAYVGTCQLAICPADGCRNQNPRTFSLSTTPSPRYGPLQEPASRSGPTGLVIAASDLPMSPGHPFYARLNAILDAAGFDHFVEAQCARF